MKRIFIFSITMPRMIIVLLVALFYHSASFCQLSISSGTNFITRGNVQVVLANLDFHNSGILDATGSSFLFTGSTSNSLIDDVGFAKFKNITINKATGKHLELHATLTVSGQVKFISGNLDLKDKYIHLGSTGSFIGESETSRAVSDNYGLITADAVLNAPNGVNMGNLGAIITSSANLGATSVTRGFDSQNLPTGGGKSIRRTFEFNSTNNTGLNATLTFKYFDAELNGLNENSLTQFHRGGNFIYANMGYTSRDAANNFVTKTAYGNLYKYTLGNPVISPDSITVFTAQCAGGFMQFNWKTQSEQNSLRFDIQSSTNGSTWKKIGSVKAAGNSNSTLSYHYSDTTLNPVATLYRLALIHINGQLTYSSVVNAVCCHLTVLKVSPNPVVSVANITIDAPANGNGTLILLNEAGQQVIQQAVTIMSKSNRYQYPLNMAQLVKGAYTLVFVQNGAMSQNIKIIKQ